MLYSRFMDRDLLVYSFIMVHPDVFVKPGSYCVFVISSSFRVFFFLKGLAPALILCYTQSRKQDSRRRAMKTYYDMRVAFPHAPGEWCAGKSFDIYTLG